MRVAVFLDHLRTVGGGERVVLTLAKALPADLIGTEFDPQMPERAGFTGVRVISLGDVSRRPPLKQIHASWKFYRSYFPDYDAYIFTGNWAHFAAERHHPNIYYCLTPTRIFYDQKEAVLARMLPWERMIARPWMSVHARFGRRAVAHCDRLVAISELVRGRIRRYYGRDSEVIYPPVRTSRLRFKEVGESWLAVNRLYPEKRVDLLLETFRRLPREKLVIVGGHSPGDRAERYIATLKPPSNVTFLGEISDEELVELYARCRGFITASVDEDFGIAPVEAMAAGKCVLATDEGGHRETIVDGSTGFLLPPDPAAFAAEIRELGEDALRTMKDACIARAREFDEGRFVDRMKAALAS